MASRASNSLFLPVDKLIGRQNYRAWAVAMRAFLEVEDLWDTIEAPENGQLNTDVKKMQKARGRIILAIEPEVYAYIEDAKTAKEAWDALARTFDDNGLTRKVNLLMEVSTTKFENCKSMEDYVARIIAASQKLNAIGTKLPSDLVGALLLAGLPTSYKPMIMALSNSGKDINADFIKTKLLEESETTGSGGEFSNLGLHAQALPAQFSAPSSSNRWRHESGQRSLSRRNSNVRCYNCNRFGHFANKCTAPRRREPNACTAAVNNESEDEDTVCALLASISRRHIQSTNVGAVSLEAELQVRSPSNALLAVNSSGSTKHNEWIVDSGASTHMCSESQYMTNMGVSNIKSVTAANRSKVPVFGEGEILLQYNGLTNKKKILLQNVLHVPNITSNLISVSAITKKGGKVVFYGLKCSVYNDKGVLILEGELSNNNIYIVKLEPGIPQEHRSNSEIVLEATSPADIHLWHRRMGHLNAAYLKQLRQAAIGVDFENSPLQQCEICAAGKLVQKPFRLNNKSATGILELIHSDVCQVEDLSIGKAKYFVTFLDDHSRKIFVYFLKQRDEVPDVVIKFINFVEKQTGRKLKMLRTDNGREYLNSKLRSALDGLGIQHQTSIVYQPQQNGRAERVNRVLLEKARCMLVESKLPIKFWAEAVSTACYLSNRSPKRCLGGRTPEEVWTGNKPDLSNLRVFGCKTRAYVPNHLRKKMEPTSKRAIMLGYCQDQKGFRLWSEEDQKVFTASNVEFFESKWEALSSHKVYLPLDSPQSIDHEEQRDQSHDIIESESQDLNEKLPVISKDAPKNRKRKNNDDNEEVPNKVTKVSDKSVKQKKHI